MSQKVTFGNQSKTVNIGSTGANKVSLNTGGLQTQNIGYSTTGSAGYQGQSASINNAIVGLAQQPTTTTANYQQGYTSYQGQAQGGQSVSFNNAAIGLASGNQVNQQTTNYQTVQRQTAYPMTTTVQQQERVVTTHQQPVSSGYVHR